MREKGVCVMFKAGDTVCYGTSGVCTIAEQKRVALGGQPYDCFILKPVYDASMKICVPCDSAPLLERMRPLPTRDDLLALLREPLPDHDPDPDARKLAYREALKSGNLHALVRMVRDIRTEQALRRAKGKAEGQKTVLGVSPTYAELDKTGLDYSEEQFNANMALNPSEWQAELESQTELFDKVGKKLPAELEEQRQLLIKSFS